VKASFFDPERGTFKGDLKGNISSLFNSPNREMARVSTPRPLSLSALMRSSFLFFLRTPLFLTSPFSLQIIAPWAHAVASL
jgi:hypothetical protein